jgi:hypothetical protein
LVWSIHRRQPAGGLTAESSPSETETRLSAWHTVKDLNTAIHP